MLIKTFNKNLLQTNTYLVACDITNEAMIIDPASRLRPLQKEVEERGLKVVAIVITHGHLDHIWRAHAYKKTFNAPLFIHRSDALLLSKRRLLSLVAKGRLRISQPADNLLEDGDVIEVGSLKFEVIHTPGHSPGGICLKYKKTIFSGDTLFAGGIGRTDLKGGNYDTLVNSIKERLFILSDDIQIFPGHGPKTTIGEEQTNNLFVRMRPEEVERLMVKMWEYKFEEERRMRLEQKKKT